MKKSVLLNGLAILTSAIALVAVFTTAQSNKKQRAIIQAENLQTLKTLMDQTIEQSVNTLRGELVGRLDSIIASLGLTIEPPSEKMDLALLAQQAKRDPAVSTLLQTGIKAVILEEMADELAAVDWLDTLSQEKLQKLLKKSIQNSFFQGFGSAVSRVDVSEIDGVDGKINRILEEFEGINSYRSNNALVKQISEMGEEAIDPLLSRLNTNFGSDFAMKMAVTDALGKLLTEEHEEIILAEFTASGNFAKLIKKYQFPAAEDEVMNKILRPAHGHVNQHVIDAALGMNAERSFPLLIDHISYGQNVSYAAKQLADEGLDITEPLRMATTRAGSVWEKANLVELCLERGMPEGYAMAAQVLRSNDEHAEHSQEQVIKQVRKYTGISGSYEEVADWLEQNQGML